MEFIDDNLKELLKISKSRPTYKKHLPWLNEVMTSWTFEEWARYVAKHWMVEVIEYRNKIGKIQAYIESNTFGEYSLALDYYGGNKAKILVRHNSEKCNFHEFWIRPYILYIEEYNFRCPVCKGSIGESRVKKVLSDLEIDFKPQFSFDDLRGKENRKMPFDFAVFDKKCNLSFLIEFDGAYHYLVNEYNPPAKLAGQQSRDAKKDKYCEEHNIDLVRIPYWEFKNIEQILLEKLKEKDF